jgi:hypothetical protein
MIEDVEVVPKTGYSMQTAPLRDWTADTWLIQVHERV